MKIIAGEENASARSFHNKPVGASAQDLLTDKQFTSLKIEIQYMAGFKPDDVAITYLFNFLKTHLHKPGGISLTINEIKPLSDTVLTHKELLTTEVRNRTKYSSSKELAVYILYTNGVYEDDKTFGMAFQNTSAVIFGKKVMDNSGSLGKPDRTKLEGTLLLHEACHLLGLVNMEGGKRDMETNHSRQLHCDNKDCLMYYAVNTTNPFSFLIKGKIPDLDDECKADMIRNGGK